MPSYKLRYFDGRGRAENARMLFALAGQSYEDIRLTQEQWKEYKPKTSFGQMPLLEVDGVVIAQSNALARYLAKTFGFAGKTPMDAARADMIVDTFEDLTKPLEGIYTCKDEEKKAELTKAYFEEKVPTILGGLEKVLCMNNGGSGFFVGDELTWADLAFINTICWIPMVGLEVPWDKAPKMKALKERVEAIPKIADWIKKRPQNQY